MTVRLISVGLSVLRALEHPVGKLGSSSRLLDAIQDLRPDQLLAREGIDDLASGRARASEWIAQALADPASSAPASRLAEVAAAVRPQDWPRDMSAELHTFARLPRSRGFALDRDDIAILICSDTSDGLLAGAWNAIAIAEGDLNRVGYVAELGVPFGRKMKENLRGSVILVRVAGMDAGEEGFRGAMRGLGYVARRLFASGTLRKGEEFQFVLSGGFKAAIPYLIGLAEAVRSVDDACLRDLGVPELLPAPEPYPVTAWVQHETAGEKAPPIRLPLRRFVAESVRQEISGYDESGRRSEPLSTTFLEGYAFDARRKWGKTTYELTPFGEGLSALLGTARVRPGG